MPRPTAHRGSHVIPDDDGGHRPDPACRCRPLMDLDAAGEPVYVHRPMDSARRGVGPTTGPDRTLVHDVAATVPASGLPPAGPPRDDGHVAQHGDGMFRD